MKPTCPDCGSENINALYESVVQVWSDGTVSFGGVSGGIPREWECEDCETFQRTDHLAHIGEQIEAYWVRERRNIDLEGGYDWRMHEHSPA